MTQHQEDKQSNLIVGKGTEETLLQGGHTEMVHRHMKKCPTLLAIRERQIVTTMRYHLTLTKMTIINKSTNNKC